MIRKTNVEVVLQQIANTIVLNTGTVKNSGLLDGKTGIVLFLFHYAQLTGKKVYRDFATELLDKIPDDLYNTMPADFVKGLTGIGWGIRYLITGNFINADAEDVLEEIDASLKNISHSDVLSDINNECPFCSKGIYFLEKNSREATGNILSTLNQPLSQNTKNLPLSYLNSILYIILQGNFHPEMFSELLNILYINMIDSIKNKYYTFPDALLLTGIIERFRQKQLANFDCKKWEALLEMLDYDNPTGIFNTGIYGLIFNRVKSNDSFVLSKLGTMDIETQINSIIKDVYRNLNLYDGLAGIGLTLCSYFQKQDETV